jgi:hypothetical protein
MEELKWNWNNIWLKYLNLDKDELLETLDWSEKYWENWASLVSPNLPWSHILEILWYKKTSWEYLDFKDKEVTDIWSWLWGLIFELENSAKKINAVDPLYYNKNREEILKEEFTRWQNRVKWLVKLKETKNNEILKLENLIKDKKWDDKLLIEKDKLGENIKKIKKNTELSQKVFDDLKTWENRRFDNNEKINLIWEYGEDTKLPNESQDYVFVNNVITKECVNPYKLLKETFRIIKTGWKIIILDEHPEVEKIFEKIQKDFKMIWNHIRVLELEKKESNILESN